MGYAGGGVERGKDAKAGGRGEANAVSRTKAIAGGNRGGHAAMRTRQWHEGQDGRTPPEKKTARAKGTSE